MARSNLRAQPMAGLGAAVEAGGRYAVVGGVFASLLGIVALKWLDLGDLAFAISALVLTAGFAIAIIAYATKAALEPGRVSAWDVAGALVFVGFGAAIIGT